MTAILSILSKHGALILHLLIAFFAPISGIILLVGLSTILDTCFGLWRAYKKGHKITSRKARFGLVPKILSYCGAVCLIYASDYYMINDLTKMAVSVEFLSTKLLALVLIAIEVKSMDESFQDVKGWSFIERITDLVVKAKNIKKNYEN
jgi:hypothetical protein